MEKITSKSNDLIKGIKKLLSSSDRRREQGLFVLEGARLVFDTLNSLFEVRYFLITSKAYDRYKSSADLMIDKADESYLISDELADKLTDTKSSQGVFAVCKMQSEQYELADASKLIALDNVQDPGNLGTILRTAEALGIDGVLVAGGCDIYNPKVLRASMGSILRLKVAASDDLCTALKELKAFGFTSYATVPDSDALSITDIDFNKKTICVIGNEANGISPLVKDMCDECITIKMLGNAESLNASIAGAITMWEMLR